MDIYFNFSYAELNEYIEGGLAEKYRFSSENGEIENIYIRREIPFLIDGERYYDAITPYGYGGPLVKWARNRNKLLEEYQEAYRNYCVQEKIVDEFVRFHPLVENHQDFSKLYDVSFNRNTLAIDLTDADYMMTQFSSTCRNKIRKATKRGVEVSIDEECVDFDEFIRIYYETMKKNTASEYYFFEKEYFEKLHDIDGYDLIMINARLSSKLIGSALFMCSDGKMHYHLSGTDPEYYSYAANNLILATAAEYGHKRGYQWLHLGGGLSSSPDDPLFQFKRSFGKLDKNLKDFYIGKAIFQPETYDHLCSIARENGIKETGFFPGYRDAH